MRLLPIGCAIATASMLVSCGGASTAAINMGRPAVFRFCFTSTTEDPVVMNHRQEATAKYLERTLNIKVDMVKTTTYGGVIEAFRANKIDGASISPFSYILATEKTPIEAIVMRGSKEGEPGEYTGVLAVPGNSPIKSVDDLVKNTKDLTISFVDPASASGFLVQNAFLQSRGVDPQRDFKKVVFSQSHPASLLTLKAGKVDVAASMQRIIKRYEETGKLSPGDVRIIWISPNIPNQPIAIRKDLPVAFKEEVRRAFLEMPDRDPEAWRMQTPSTLPAAPGTVYVAANDAMFDSLRKMAKSVPNLSLLEH